jgi:hypothetical protein
MAVGTIQEIIAAYNYLIKGIDARARATEGRAYGGIVRMGKGKLGESIAQILVEIAWQDLGRPMERLSFRHDTFNVPIRKDYINKIRNPIIQKHISENMPSYYYGFKPDVPVFIDKKFAMAIESKAFTENAMIKRILIDFTLLKLNYPNLDCVLCQLESQLGGDYSNLGTVTYGSRSTHTLLSYFDIDLTIITLLKGERKVDKPIHKAEFFKPLASENLTKAIETLKLVLQKYR